MALQLPVGLGLFIIKDSRLYSDTPQSAGLLWTRVQPVANTSIGRTTLTITLISLARFETAIPPSEGPQTHVLDLAATEIGCL